MPLDPEKIKELYAKKNRPRASSGTRTSSGKKIDPKDRSHQAWFALNHLLIDHETNDMVWCDNPNCVDPRDNKYGQTVVEVNGRKMCRFCFIDGWLLENPAQVKLGE